MTQPAPDFEAMLKKHTAIHGDPTAEDVEICRAFYQAGLLEAAKVTEGYPAYDHITARIKERAAMLGSSP